jgi:ribosomal protein S6
MAKQKEMEMHEDEAALDAGSEPRVYELGFHLDPELPSEEVKKAYEAIHDLIASKGSIVGEGNPQKIPLAYTISRQETTGRRDFDSAYFSWIAYEATPDAHRNIVSSVGEDKRLVRFLDVSTTKEAVRHAVELQELSLKMQEQQPEEIETEQNAQLDAALESAVV